MNIELLESRIAPALVIVSPILATFTDVDGDFVTIKASKPILDDGDFVRVAAGLGDQLQRIVLSDDGTMAEGLSLTITATPKDVTGDGVKDGDGHVNIGRLDAFGVNLGAVSIDGDLGQIIAGNNTSGVLALKSLSVSSFGQSGTSTGATLVECNITGTLGSLTVAGDIRGVRLQVVAGGINSMTVGGSWVYFSGNRFNCDGDVGNVRFGGSITGSPLFSIGGTFKSIRVEGSDTASITANAIGSVSVAGDQTGGIFSNSGIQKITIGGTLTGSVMAAGKIGAISIGEDLVGSASINSALIATTGGGDIGKLTIGRSLVGGFGSHSARIECDGALGPVKIGGSILGSLGELSGSIYARGRIASLTLGGSLVGGIDYDTTTADTGNGSGGIRSDAIIGAVRIGGDVQGGSGAFSARLSSMGRIDSVSVLGSLIGGMGVAAGQISPGDTSGPIVIGGDVLGGSGDESAMISAGGTLASIVVKGSVVGGSDTRPGDGTNQGEQSAWINVISLGSLKIGGSLRGGDAFGSGAFTASGDVGSITIGGSVAGGPSTGEFAPSGTGAIIASGTIGSVKIGGDLRGSDGHSSGPTTNSGTIQGKRIGSVTVGGSIIAGFNGGAHNGAIDAQFDLGPVVIGGSLIGNTSRHVEIFARGQEAPTATSDVAIKSITIGGRVEQTWILAGVDSGGVGVDGNAQIGAVKVGRDWIASNLESGCTSSDGNFGDANDAIIPGGTLSKIASITINGQVFGGRGTNETFGIFAKTIGSFKYSGVAVLLNPGPSTDTFALGKAHPLGASLSTTNTDGFAVHVFEV